MERKSYCDCENCEHGVHLKSDCDNYDEWVCHKHGCICVYQIENCNDYEKKD